MELVKTKSEDGVCLDGVMLRSTAARDQAPADLVICHHGVACNFYDTRLYGPLGELLLSAGCDVLKVNNRGHDVVYNQFGRGSPTLRRTRGRLGAAFELMDDCRLDWKAWTDFAEAEGYRRIALWSHSLGAVKTLHFLSSQGDPRLVFAIASSPPRFQHQSYLASAAGEAFGKAYERALALEAAGEADTIFSISVPTPSLFSARTFIDKYGPEDRFDYLPMFGKIRTPLFVTVGGSERDTAFIGLNEHGADWVKAVPGAGFARIPEADHFYTGQCGALWGAAQAWISGLR